MTLKERMQRSFEVFGRRNRLFFRSSTERINFLNFAISDLQDAVRKEGDTDYLGLMLARVASRIFCCVEGYYELPFVEMLARKYPLVGCVYCARLPCECGELRPEAMLAAEPHNDQLQWDIREWCTAFDAVYGEKNRHSGVVGMVLRLYKEGSEIMQIDAQIPEFKGTMRELEEEISLELADVFAWTCAIANFFKIDLQQCVHDRFYNGCIKCGKNPCQCTHFSKRQLYVHTVTKR